MNFDYIKSLITIVEFGKDFKLPSCIVTYTIICHSVQIMQTNTEFSCRCSILKFLNLDPLVLCVGKKCNFTCFLSVNNEEK